MPHLYNAPLLIENTARHRKRPSQSIKKPVKKVLTKSEKNVEYASLIRTRDSLGFHVKSGKQLILKKFLKLNAWLG